MISIGVLALFRKKSIQNDVKTTRTHSALDIGQYDTRFLLTNGYFVIIGEICYASDVLRTSGVARPAGMS
jgi:hypothetical protein